MKFKTYSGSIYELDQENKRIRRLTGNANPTERQGKDGDWKPYKELLNGPEKDRSLTIVWNVTEEGVIQTTQTSYITEILVES